MRCGGGRGYANRRKVYMYGVLCAGVKSVVVCPGGVGGGPRRVQYFLRTIWEKTSKASDWLIVGQPQLKAKRTRQVDIDVPGRFAACIRYAV